MTKQRLQKKHLPQALKEISRITGVKISQKDVGRASAHLFGRNSGQSRKVMYLPLPNGAELALSRQSPKSLIVRIDADFSSAGKVFRPWKQAWEQEVPAHVRRSFGLNLAAMSRELLEASEE